MWLTGFIFGILGSFHCVGMCGPIAFLLPVDRDNGARKIMQISLYHFGRILSYAAIGLLFGLIGKSFSLFGFQQQLSIIIGILLILAFLIPQVYKGKINASGIFYKLIAQIKNKLGARLKQKSAGAFFQMGVLNGFLPCGLVYMAVFGAIASGGITEGAFYMALFGLGTVPLMTAAIYLGNYISLNVRRKITKLVPVFVVVIGILFIIRGLGLGIPYLSPQEMSPMITDAPSCH